MSLTHTVVEVEVFALAAAWAYAADGTRGVRRVSQEFLRASLRDSRNPEEAAAAALNAVGLRKESTHLVDLLRYLPARREAGLTWLDLGAAPREGHRTPASRMSLSASTPGGSKSRQIGR